MCICVCMYVCIDNKESRGVVQHAKDATKGGIPGQVVESKGYHLELSKAT